MQEAKKNTLEEHTDFPLVSAALEQIKIVADGINEAIRDQQNSDAILQLQALFLEPVPLLRYSRILIKQGRIRKQNGPKAKKIHFVVFSDSILIAKFVAPSALSKKNRLELVDLIPIDEHFCLQERVTEVDLANDDSDEDTDNKTGNEDSNAVIVTTDPNSEPMRLVFPDEDSKAAWIAAIKKATTPVHSIFGLL